MFMDRTSQFYKDTTFLQIDLQIILIKIPTGFMKFTGWFLYVEEQRVKTEQNTFHEELGQAPWPTALLRINIGQEGHERIFQQNVIRGSHEIKTELQKAGLKMLVLPWSGLKGMVCFGF